MLAALETERLLEGVAGGVDQLGRSTREFGGGGGVLLMGREGALVLLLVLLRLLLLLTLD